MCNLQGLFDGNDSDVSAVWPDQADFRDADALVDSKFVSADKLLLIPIDTNPARVGWFFAGESYHEGGRIVNESTQPF